MKLLVVAAEERELRGILAHAHQRPVEKRLAGGSTCPTGINWARRAALGEYDLLLAANGAGPARAAVAVQRAAAVFQPDAIVSTGFCGALEDELGVASVVVATEVRGANGRFHARMPAASPPHCRGVVSTIDHVAQSAAEKRTLCGTGASVVDMEAAAVAGCSAAMGLPFFCIKAVTDLAGETMANDLNAALRPDGHFDTIRILGSIFGRPFVRLPELLRLWSRSARAARALGDFFADCRF
jgi:adenosylhomocysteine nucleosidase